MKMTASLTSLNVHGVETIGKNLQNDNKLSTMVRFYLFDAWMYFCKKKIVCPNSHCNLLKIR